MIGDNKIKKNLPKSIMIFYTLCFAAGPRYLIQICSEIPRALRCHSRSYTVFFVVVFCIIGKTKKFIHLHCQSTLRKYRASNCFSKIDNKHFTFYTLPPTLGYHKN